MKEKCIMKFMYVEHNLRAIEDTKWLMQYLKEFPWKRQIDTLGAITVLARY